MFPRGVSHYVDLMQDLIPEMKDGTVRTAIDTGCGVSLSFQLLKFSNRFGSVIIFLSFFLGCELGWRSFGPWDSITLSCSKR